MKVTLQKQESNQVCLEVELEAKQVHDTYERKFKEASKSVNVPGFRKGKAPKKLLEKYIHQDMLKQDVIEHLVSESYSEALKNLEEPIEPIAQPKIEVVKFELNQPMVFKATLEVKPEVKLGEYKNLSLEIDPEDEISDEKVDKELKELAKRHGKLVEAKREVQEGDVVTVDIYGEVEGEPIPQGTTDNLQMEVKPGNFVPGFTEQMVGMKAEEEKEIKITFPADYPVVDLRDKEGDFKIYIKDVKTLDIPEVNDEFVEHMASHHGYGDTVKTVEDLKGKIKEELERNRESSKVIRKQQKIIDTVVETSNVEVPDSMLQRELFAMWANGEGKTLEDRGVAKDVLEASWENWNSREDVKEEARKRIKTTLVLSEISRVEQLSISPEELNNELKGISQIYNLPVEQLRDDLIKNNRMVPLIDELLSLKIVNWLEENSKVKVIGEPEETESSSSETVESEEETKSDSESEQKE